MSPWPLAPSTVYFPRGESLCLGVGDLSQGLYRKYPLEILEVTGMYGAQLCVLGLLSVLIQPSSWISLCLRPEVSEDLRRKVSCGSLATPCCL